MKKVLASLVLVGLLIVPTVASAWTLDDIWAIFRGDQPEEAPETNVIRVLGSLTNWLLAILLVVAAIFIIVAGYYFVTASGDPDKTKTARNFVLYALIGVLVGFLAKGLVSLVAMIVQPGVTL